MKSLMDWLIDMMDPPGYTTSSSSNQFRQGNEEPKTKVTLAEDNHSFETRPRCAECGKRFKEMPKSQKTCSECGTKSLIRKHYHTSEEILIPAEKKDEYSKEKNEYYAAKKLMHGLSNLKPIEDRISKMKVAHSKRLKEKFGQPPKGSDLAWSIANKLAIDLASQGNLNMAGSVYFDMGLYVHRIGEDHLKLVRTANELELKRIEANGITNKVEVIGGEGCDQCSEIAGNVYSISKAIDKQPIPCVDCTMSKFNEDAPRGWCRCVYTAKV